jgi:hypothetical protein
MRKVCRLLESKTKDGDEIWLEKYFSSPNIYSLDHGWPQLKILVYKEAISIAENAQDHLNTILFTAEMLRKLFRHLTPKDQEKYSEMLQKIVMYHRKQNNKKPLNNQSVFPLIQGDHGVILGVPIVKKMTLVEPTPRYCVTRHQPKIETSGGPKSTFLYSPFEQKKGNKHKIIFVILI